MIYCCHHKKEQLVLQGCIFVTTRPGCNHPASLISTNAKLWNYASVPLVTLCYSATNWRNDSLTQLCGQVMWPECCTGAYMDTKQTPSAVKMHLELLNCMELDKGRSLAPEQSHNTQLPMLHTEHMHISPENFHPYVFSAIYTTWVNLTHLYIHRVNCKQGCFCFISICSHNMILESEKELDQIAVTRPYFSSFYIEIKESHKNDLRNSRGTLPQKRETKNALKT